MPQKIYQMAGGSMFVLRTKMPFCTPYSEALKYGVMFMAILHGFQGLLY